MNDTIKEHWDKVYSSNDTKKLGWYEEIPGPSIKLLTKCNLDKDAAIFDVGAGATTLIDYLIGKKKSLSVNWIVDDLTRPKDINQLKDFALWHDRAVLHFLVEESWQQTYFSTLKRIVQKGGYVIIAAFSIGGAKKCNGLDVVNYDRNMLSEKLGNEFELIEAFDYIYHMPSGNTRPFIYTLFQKK